MKRLLRVIPLLVVIGIRVGAWWYTSRPPTSLTLTGIVTTNHIVVSPQITGRITELMAQEGDAVKAGQLLAVLSPDELREERAFYSFSADGAGSQVRRAKRPCASRSGRAPIRSRRPRPTWLPPSRRSPPRRPSSTTRRSSSSARSGWPRRAWTPCRPRLGAHGLRREQVAARRAAQTDRSAEGRRRACQVQRRAGRHAPESGRRQSAAAGRRGRAAAKADVRLAYTEIHAPIDGIVDVRAACRARSSRPGSRSSR